MSRLFGRFRRAFAAQGSLVLRLVLFAAGCVAVLLWLVSIIGNIDYFADNTGYEVELEDASGLLVNDSVKVAGVEVGRVTSIDDERGKAVIGFEADSELDIRDSSQAGVRWRNILGQKYLYIYPGDDGDVLEPGDRLPVEQALDSADVGDFLNSLGPVLQALDPQDANAFVEAVTTALQGNEAKVRDLIGDSADLAGTLGDLDGEVGSVVTNMEQVITALAGRDGDLDQLVRNLASVADELAARNDSVQRLVTDFADVQVELERLLRENRGDLDATIDDLVVIARTLDRHEGDLEKALATLPDGTVAYHTQSSFGQWFNVRSVVTCFANQTECVQEDVGNTGSPAATGTEPLIGPASGASVRDIVRFANAGGVPLP